MAASITHYTTSEGGKWIRHSTALPTDTELDRCIASRVPDRGKRRLWVTMDIMPGRQVHSFRSDDGREWDCINGWRPDLTELVSRVKAA